MGNIRNFIESVTTNGGASLNINSGEFNPTNGYFVSVVGAEKKINDFSGDDLEKYILENVELLNLENVFLGGWMHKGEIYLDCSQQIADKRTAIIKGMERGQIAIFDAENGKEISLPTAQKCGTETQKKTYMSQKATELCEN
jgi:hypothetical protein